MDYVHVSGRWQERKRRVRQHAADSVPRGDAAYPPGAAGVAGRLRPG